MRVTLLILVALTRFKGRAADHDSAGRAYYASGEFGKAAALFQVSCNTNNDAEACY
jgi:hypothetical protein